MNWERILLGKMKFWNHYQFCAYCTDHWPLSPFGLAVRIFFFFQIFFPLISISKSKVEHKWEKSVKRYIFIRTFHHVMSWLDQIITCRRIRKKIYIYCKASTVRHLTSIKLQSQKLFPLFPHFPNQKFNKFGYLTSIPKMFENKNRFYSLRITIQHVSSTKVTTKYTVTINLLFTEESNFFRKILTGRFRIREE